VVDASEQWYTVQEVADLLQLHPQTLRAWLRRGDLPGTFLSRRAGWRIAASDLAAFMAARRPAPTPNQSGEREMVPLASDAGCEAPEASEESLP
jgi:excisionase family DNA binding protein